MSDTVGAQGDGEGESQEAHQDVEVEEESSIGHQQSAPKELLEEAEEDASVLEQDENAETVLQAGEVSKDSTHNQVTDASGEQKRTRSTRSRTRDSNPLQPAN